MKKFPTILIDTREQKPYTFKGYKTLKRKLNFGDYSLQGFRSISIERKSLSDFFSTVANLKNLARFNRQLMEMSAKRFSFIVIEASPEQILFGSKFTQASGHRVLYRILELSLYYSIPIIFGGNRIGAESCTLSILKAAYKNSIAY